MPAGTATRSGRCRPPGSPTSSSRASTSRCARWSRASPARAARSRPPRRTSASAATSSPSSARSSARRSSSAASCVPAAPSASGATPTSSAASAARRSPRCARRWSRPSRRRSGASCRRWHGIDRRATLREALVPLQALSLPVALWESDVLPRRVPGYRPELLDQLCATGEVVWVGAGLDRVALFFREDAAVLGRPSAAPAPEGDAHDAIRAALEPAPSSGSTCSRRPASRPRRRCPRSGIWSGRAR